MSNSAASQPVELWRGPRNFSLGLPGSKSLTLRDCAIAALAQGRSEIAFPGKCDDYDRMLDCLQRLGARVSKDEADTVAIEGSGGKFVAGEVSLDCGQSAVTTRLMLAVAALRPEATLFNAHASMRARPNGPLIAALRGMGATIDCAERDGHLPATVRGRRDLTSKVRLKADVSSQYLTALLLIGPLLPGGLEVTIEGELASKPYVDLTFDEMNKFGVSVEHDNYKHLRVASGAYAASRVRVEGDASAASYWAALATLHRSRITLVNLGNRTRQGDYAFLEVCERLGARVNRNADSTEIIGPEHGALQALQGPVDMSRMPDVAPTLMAMAPWLPARTHLTGLATLRVKECDRIAAPARELRKLGVELEEGPDSMVIEPAPPAVRKCEEPVTIETYHDHRIAMSFGVLGTLRAGLLIANPACVGKTYPQFWDDLQRAAGGRSDEPSDSAEA